MTIHTGGRDECRNSAWLCSGWTHPRGYLDNQTGREEARMTLGELIDEAIEATIDKLTEGTMDANVIRGVSFDLEKALPALWAAEVHEGEVSEMWLWLEGHDADGPKQLAQDGQRVRVIVVPLE